MHIHIVFVALGFPIWIRITHYINLLFIGLLIRSGIQIVGAHRQSNKFLAPGFAQPSQADADHEA